MSGDAWIFDFDNHYYESPDAFTRHQDRTLGNRGIRWADVDGKRRLLIGGTINSYIANPTFNPVSRPGALYDWYRGNPRRQQIKDAFGELEPLRSEYQDRDIRLKVLDEQGLAGILLFPTLGVGVEDALKHDPEAAAKVFHAFNLWLNEDWGYRYQERIFAVPYIPLLDPIAAAEELGSALDADAVVVNVRNAPVPVSGGYRSPFDPAYDAFWGLAEESGVVVATHAGVDGYDALVQMWEPGAGESSLFRSPLRGIVTKAAPSATSIAPPCVTSSSSGSPACGWRASRTARRGSRTCCTGWTTPQIGIRDTSRNTPARYSASTFGSPRSGRTASPSSSPTFAPIDSSSGRTGPTPRVPESRPTSSPKPSPGSPTRTSAGSAGVTRSHCSAYPSAEA